MALVGFFDESGEHGKRGKLRRLTLGGFFARWENVQQLCERWRAALDAENLGEFHMKDIASDEHLFAEWPPERQQRLMRFAAILCDTASEFGAFSYPVMRRGRGAFVDTYGTALSRVLIVASELAQRTGDQVRLVFAYTDEIREARIAEGLGLWPEFLESYKVARSRSEPALQAAEIVARGLKRIMEDGTVPASFQAVLLTGKPIRFWPENPIAAGAMARAMRRAE